MCPLSVVNLVKIGIDTENNISVYIRASIYDCLIIVRISLKINQLNK